MRFLTICFITTAIFFIFSCGSGKKNIIIEPVETIPEKKEDPVVKDGPGKIFWEDNTIKGEGNFTSYLKEGNWTLFYKTTGEIFARGEYLNDMQHGEWLYYYKNGETSSEGSYEKNQKTGLWTGFYETGEKQWETKYVIRDTESGKTGLIEGKRTSYYKSGKIQKVEEFRNGQKKGKFLEYYENGRPKEISWYDNNKHNGRYNLYWETGSIKEQGIFLDDLRNGVWKFGYDNDQLRMTGAYMIIKSAVSGENISKQYGVWQYFSKKGLLQKEGMFKEGIEDGFWKYYSYTNNRQRQLKMELTLIDGSAAGFGKLYNENELIEEGELTGPVKAIYEKIQNNNVIAEESLAALPLDNVNVNIEYRWKGDWELPVKNGKWTKYYSSEDKRNKKIHFEAVFSMNKLNGLYKEYYENGKLKSEGEFMNDMKNGIWRVYNENGTLNENESGRWMLDEKMEI